MWFSRDYSSTFTEWIRVKRYASQMSSSQQEERICLDGRWGRWQWLTTWAERSGHDPFLLCITWWPINHVTIGWHRPSYSFKCSSLPFTRTFLLAPFLKSPLRSPDWKVSVLGMRFHHFGVNRRLKRREKYSFLTENVLVQMPPESSPCNVLTIFLRCNYCCNYTS